MQSRTGRCDGRSSQLLSCSKWLAIRGAAALSSRDASPASGSKERPGPDFGLNGAGAARLRSSDKQQDALLYFAFPGSAVPVTIVLRGVSVDGSAPATEANRLGLGPVSLIAFGAGSV